MPLLLISCSYIGNSSFIQTRDKEYLKAQSVPPLKIPPGVSAKKFDSYYPIPDKNYPNGQKDIDLTPPGLNN
jgi:uncharacterized lipoprotein